MARSRLGLWLIGARGSVATTAICGLVARKKGWIGSAGLVSELEPFRKLALPAWDSLVVGGHEIRDVPLADEAVRILCDGMGTDRRLVTRCRAELGRIDANIRPGTLIGTGRMIEKLASPSIQRARETPRQAIERLQQDLQQFAKQHRLDDVVVVNVASTEPAHDPNQPPRAWRQLDALLDRPRKCPLPASSLYAIAALDLGMPYINFTPSLGSAPEAIQALAVERETCHMGCDGKTGETLLKSVLAPMFAKRNLEVMSWVGHNIFGNLDGKVLDEKENKRSKVASKDRLLHEILGYHPQTLVSIEYIESLKEWKTAWDHVHFRGFLGTPMSLQFTWQGCDSILAAPLVLDLARLTAVARQRRVIGRMPFLASFFKSPLGSEEHDFGRQFDQLERWARGD